MKQIKNIVIIGDPHLNSATPQSRTDDYAVTSINKLLALLDLCMEKGYNTILALGDFFHKSTQPLAYMYEVIKTLNKFKQNGIDFYSIVGNSHDILYDKLENLPRSAIGVLFEVGVLKELQMETFCTKEGYNISLHGYHFPQTLQPVETRPIVSEVNICVAHRFYDEPLHKDSLTPELIESLGYNIYCFGHSHTPFDLTTVGSKIVVRPGRFMRGTADNYNKEGTQVFADVINFNGSKEQPRITVVREIIKTEPASSIFNTQSLTKTKTDKVLQDLAFKVDSLLDKMDISNTSETSVYSVLDALEIDVRIKNRLESYLSAKGLFRNEINL